MITNFLNVTKRLQSSRLNSLFRAYCQNIIKNDSKFDQSELRLLAVINNENWKSFKHVLNEKKFNMIQKWINENSESITKFDDISQIKGIGKKTIEELRTLCKLKLQNSMPCSSHKKIESTDEYQSIHFYEDIQPKSLIENGNFILYDEGEKSNDQRPHETISTSAQIHAFTDNPGKLRGIKLVLEPRLTKYTSIRSFTSIYQDASAITCTSFSSSGDWEKDIKIEAWNYYKVQSVGVGVKHLYQICDQISQIVDQLPPSDIYIMDDHFKAQHFRKAITPKRVSEIIQMNQQCVILFTILQRKIGQPNVFFMAYNIVGRMYDLFVGREPISTQSIIKSVLQNSNKNLEESSDRPFAIEIADDIKNSYFKSYPVERECLGKSMLIGLTFVRLGLIKN